MFRSRTLISLLLVSILAAGLAFLAVGVGYYLAQRRFIGYLEHYNSTTTLGRLLNESAISATLTKIQREKIFDAYYEPRVVEDKAGQVSWGVPNVPTPFVGVAPAPGVQNNAHINSLQFRDKRELSLPKPSELIRIFLVGGSTAYGSGAPSDEETIGAYLESILNGKGSQREKNRVEVFTLANPAWSSTHERIAIENRLSELEPDLVISLSGNNDIFWGAAGRNIFWFRTFSDEHFWSIISTAYDLAGIDTLADVVSYSRDPVPPSLVAQRLEKNVRLAAYALLLSRVRYLYILQPSLAVTKKALTAREREFVSQEVYYAECYEEIRSRLRNMKDDNFLFFDLSRVFDESSSVEEIFLDSFHFGDRGNEQIAYAIAERVMALLPSR